MLAHLTHSETAAVDYVHGDEGLLMAPVHAVPRLLERAGLTLQDFDLYEIHEAFAAQVLCTLKAWEDDGLGAIDRSKLNVAGGSLAAGHPFAATGGRILATVAKLLAERGSGRALVSICAAGGQGVVAIVERSKWLQLDADAGPARPRRAHARFAEEVIRPVADHYDREEEFPWPVLERAAQEGFYNPLFYRDLIGDPTGLSLPLFMEELFWGCAGIGLAIVMPALALSAMAQAATPEQLLRWAPECFGEPGDLKLAALCVSEPEGGSDVRNLRTRARRDGDDWVIDGHKIWIGNGGIADVHVVNATVDPELGHRGQALFIVPGGTPGLRLVRKLEKLGCRASHTAELRFEGCRIPAEHLLGGDAQLERRLAEARERERQRRAPPRSARSSRRGRWSPPRRSASLARRSSSRATTPPSARRSAGRSSTSRASRSRSPTSPPTSTPRGC